MSIEKLKIYEASEVAKRMCGLVLAEGEKSRLYDICIKYEISITYPSLFADDKHYYLWGISKNGIGLVGTMVMNGLKANNGRIFESLDELEDYLKGDQL